MKYTATLMLSLMLLSVPVSASAALINFTTASDTGNTAPLWVAKDAGFFEKYGNTTQLVFIPGSTVSIAALVNNDAHMALLSPTPTIANNAKGMDLVILMSFNQVLDNAIFGKKGISGIKQIKNVAIGRFGSSSDFIARYLLQREGLKPEIDVALLQLGIQSSRLLAVEAGHADAAIVTPPTTVTARKKGYPLLVDGSQLNIPYTSSIIAARRSFIQKERPVVLNLMRALIESIAYYKTHKEETFKIMGKYLRTQDRDVFEENFRVYNHSLRPYATNEMLELSIQELGKSDPNILKMNPERFVDHSILKELESMGFINHMAGQYGIK
jgi:ABC-type nitrate/sulfonate/bicarbonate transport system substrate-binding protein